MKAVKSLIVVVLVARGVWAATAAIDADRMLNVDGKRMFVLGLYEDPGDDALLADVAHAGFNLVHVGVDTAALDRLWGQGLYAWVNTGGAIDLGDDPEGREAALQKMVDTAGRHPALLVWEVPDEALWNTWYSASQWRRGAEPRQQNELIAALTDADLTAKLRDMRAQVEAAYSRGEPEIGEQLADDIWRALGKEPPHPDLNLSNAPERAKRLAQGMVKGYQYLKGIDNAHPIWMNHAPRNSIAQLARFDEAADAVGCDIYPVPEGKVGHSDLADKTLTCVGAYTRRMQEAAPGKPVWMVLQGFGWADLGETKSQKDREELRKPKPDESRFMAYDAIVNGARGILYWGTAYIDKKDPFWTDLLALVTELSAQQPVLSAPDASLDVKVMLAPTWGSIDRGIRVLPKQVGEHVYLLVVNEWSDPVVYTLHGLESLEGVSYRDNTTEQETIVQHGTLTLPIRGYGVHILEPQVP